MTTTRLTIRFSLLWMTFGVLTPAIDLAVITSRSSQYFTLTARCYQPGSSGVNAFAHDWSSNNNWLCPLVCLTCRVVNHLQVCNAAGTLVISLWKSAHFWPRLCSNGLHWIGFVHDWVIRFPIFRTFSSEAKLRIQFSFAVRSHSRWPLCV